MTYPLVTGTNLVQSIDYNSLYDIVTDVFAVDDDGYGLYAYASTPISSSNLIRVREWRNLQRDLVEVAYFHITNINGSYPVATIPGTPLTTSTLITAQRHNDFKAIADHISANRYTCAEGQYYRDPITGVSTSTTNAVSSRTIEWGITENYIEHRVRVRWANRLVARHFFNTGGILTWTPYHSNNGLNDIDSEWANFIATIQSSQFVQPISYNRSDFIAQIAGTTATIYAESGGFSSPGFTIGNGSGATYSKGTLNVLVELFKANSEDWVEFKITFANNDSAELVVSPTVGYWNYTV